MTIHFGKTSSESNQHNKQMDDHLKVSDEDDSDFEGSSAFQTVHDILDHQDRSAIDRSAIIDNQSAQYDSQNNSEEDDYMAFDREEETDYDQKSFVQRPSGYKGPVRWSAYSADSRSQYSETYSRRSFVSVISRGNANSKCVLCRSEPVGPDYLFSSF